MDRDCECCREPYGSVNYYSDLDEWLCLECYDMVTCGGEFAEGEEERHFYDIDTPSSRSVEDSP